MALNDEAINFLQDYVDDIQKEGKKIYHVHLGKLLVDYGIKFKDLNKKLNQKTILLKMLNLYECTNFVQDESSLPYVFYYKGQALITLILINNKSQYDLFDDKIS